MKLPNREYVKISKDKLENYILSETHPVGKFKARLFKKLGFNKNNIHLFEMQLRKIAQTQDVTNVTPTLFGIKYTIDGEIETPNGSLIKIRSIWITEEKQNNPRFVTVYPV